VRARRLLAAGAALAACRAASVAPVAPPPGGVAIALYARAGGGYGVVDDRRWVDIDGGELVLDRIDPGAALPSLVIEPVAGGPLEVGACLRDRIAAPRISSPGAPPGAPRDAIGATRSSAPADAVLIADQVGPVLRCHVEGPPGRYLVRLLYVTPRLGYRVQHDIAMTAPDRAEVASRFAIATPAWRTRAEIALFDGAPGGEPPPREVARGSIALDGGTAVLAVPARAVAARLRRVYDGAVDPAAGTQVRDARDPRWAAESHAAVWVWLELAELAELPPGPVRAHVELAGEPIRDADVPAAGRRHSGGELRLPLWIDDALRGKRDRWTEAPGDAAITDRFVISVANRGDAAREVWIEEALRPAARRTISHAWPRAPELGRQRLRLALAVAPGAVERARFVVEYER
jgi:hypothetical protein